jgi:hypothetical protein
MNLQTGDEFWLIYVRRYDTILQVPRLERCVVTGGGSTLVVYRVTAVNGQSDERTLHQANGFSPHDPRQSRSRLEERAYPTRKEALVSGLAKLRDIRRKASQDMIAAANAIFEIENELSDQPAGQPAGQTAGVSPEPAGEVEG